jgi:hypothetical protein
MAKKDFTQVNTGRVYDAIAEVTQEAQEVQDTQQKRQKRKELKTYTEDETQEILETMQTSGRKGCKLPRVNMAFSPANYEYINIMARVRGEGMTAFVNHIVDEHRAAHQDIYEKAIEFRNSL